MFEVLYNSYAVDRAIARRASDLPGRSNRRVLGGRVTDSNHRDKKCHQKRITNKVMRFVGMAADNASIYRRPRNPWSPCAGSKLFGWWAHGACGNLQRRQPGVRDELMQCLIVLGRDTEARQLYLRYEKDPKAVWHWSQALLDFLQYGDAPTACQSLAAAIKNNRHVPPNCSGTTESVQGRSPITLASGRKMRPSSTPLMPGTHGSPRQGHYPGCNVKPGSHCWRCDRA